MTARHFLLALCLTAAVGMVSADQDEKFFISTHFKGDAVAYLNRGSERLEKGDFHGAQKNFDASLRTDPKFWPAYLLRAQLFAQQKQWRPALEDCDALLRLPVEGYDKDFFAARHRVRFLGASILRRLGYYRESLQILDDTIVSYSDDETKAAALSERARLRATCPDPAFRNPKAALADAQRACRLDYWKKAIYIDALAAAYAANGDFEAAMRYEEQAIKSGKFSDEELQDAKTRLNRYSHRQANRRTSR